MRPVWRSGVAALALLVAGCWLSDGPVGVMACYMLAAVALAASLLSRSWAHLLRASIAYALVYEYRDAEREVLWSVGDAGGGMRRLAGSARFPRKADSP